MKWVIVFFMLVGHQTPQQFIVDQQVFSSQRSCERAITTLNLPQEPRPYCAKMGTS
jgi:hypothetical protein